MARSINKNSNRENSQYKVFWIGKKTGNGGVRVFVTKKWIEKVLEVKRVSDRLMMIKLKTDKGTVVVSTLKIISI